MGLFIDDLATYAQTNSIGTIGTDLFRFALTPSPDAQVALIPYSGLASEQRFGSDDLEWEFPRVQVIARGPVGDHRAAFTKAQAAYLAFGKIAAESLSSTFWHTVKCLQPPFSMGTDDTGRPLWGFNLACEKEV